jgi:ankyrin repeat protein
MINPSSNCLQDGCTPFHIAAGHGRLGAVKALVEGGAEMNAAAQVGARHDDFFRCISGAAVM